MNHRLLLGYYAATLIFLILDAGFGINLRIAFLDGYPGWRGAYYVVCLACLVLVVRKPAWEAVVGGIESTFTLSALIISMAVRAMSIGGGAVDGQFVPVTLPEVVNFLISGSVAYVAWFRGMRAFHDIS